MIQTGLSEVVQVVALVCAIGTPIGAFFAVKFGLNGARENIGEIKRDVKEIMKGQSDMRVEVAEICTDLEGTRGWLGALDKDLKRHIEMGP